MLFTAMFAAPLRLAGSVHAPAAARDGQSESRDLGWFCGHFRRFWGPTEGKLFM
jgi:hypothetical protein